MNIYLAQQVHDAYKPSSEGSSASICNIWGGDDLNFV